MNEGGPSWKDSIKKGPDQHRTIGRTLGLDPERIPGRSLEQYEYELQFDRRELEGKTVLDLGSGLQALLDKSLKKAGIHATVISLSPDYSNEEHRKFLEPTRWEKFKAVIKDERAEPLAVAGVGEQLPFKDESFDEVLALASVSAYSERYQEFLSEICRVLKNGGIARIGALYDDTDRKYGQVPRSIQYSEFIEKLGYEYELVPIPITTSGKV